MVTEAATNRGRFKRLYISPVSSSGPGPNSTPEMGHSRFEDGEPPSTDDLSRDRLFELLAHEERRCLIGCLQEMTTPIAVADLTRCIVHLESGDVAGDQHDELQRIHCSLYHHHVPKLADYGVLEHDRDRNTVDLGPNFDRLAAHVGPISGVEDDGLER